MTIFLILLSLASGGLLGYLAAKLHSQAKFGLLQKELACLNLAHQTLIAQEAQHTNAIAEQKMRIDELQQQLHATAIQLATAHKEKEWLTLQQAQHQQHVKELQETLKLQFENLGHKIFSENTKQFKEESQLRLVELLSPLKGDITTFRQKMEDAFGNQAKENYSLKNEIARIVKINEEMTTQAEHLTKALKGDVKVQGNWGEMILERLLEESGLRRDEDYILQGTEMGIKHFETGQTLKPDVIVKLPENRHIIIDAKVSLTDYERYCRAESEDERLIHLKPFLGSVKKHVNDLEQRRYQDAEQLNTPDFVLMFMPIESAFLLALQQDHELHQYAWGKKVIIVCPTTLFSTLKTVASLWTLERQHKNTVEIARQGGLLYDKIVGFVDDMQKLGKQLAQSQTTYQDALNKLKDGKGNILARTQHLQKLGVKTSKNLAELLTTELVSVDEEVS